MSRFLIRARQPWGDGAPPRFQCDPDVLASYLQDAAHFPGGHATELAAPTTEMEVADVLRAAKRVLPVGAQSSLTGGATPMGETLLSTARLNRIESIDLAGADTVSVQAGVTMAALDEVLARNGRYYPPAPTFGGAFVGGTIATNAAGAATFKYGTTRDWVQAITIVLPSGDVLDIERGATIAHSDGHFDLQLASRIARVPVPTYTMPDVPKLSAGYWAEPDMDLIDLFIGSEGTLGIVTAATLRVLPTRPAFCFALIPFLHRLQAMKFVRRLRDTSMETWKTGNPRGVDISAIEHLDARSLEIMREDGLDRANGVNLPRNAVMALLVTLELPPDTTPEAAFHQIGGAETYQAPDSPLVRFCRMLIEADVFDDVEIAVPGDRERAAQLLSLREGVPASVNRRVGLARRQDERIAKTAGDMIVPFERMEQLLDFYDAEFRKRGLDAAVWGHISDGNVHPNVIPRSFADVESGRNAMLAFGREAIRLGGAPLAEHGVGRNRIKQQLLKEMYGEAGIEEMRAVKRAIDPEWKMAPGVLFTKETGK
jgi:D-lactate dehydrogenase (cytochrome)